MLSVSGYDIDGVVHAGRDLIVHRGRRLADNRPVLIKSPRSDRPTRPALATLQREQAILQILDDERVTRVLAALPSSHGLSLILEDFGGEPLRQRSAGAALEIAEFLALAIGITDALAAIHGHGIVHRDLRPETILLDHGGRVALTGFGRASPAARADEPGPVEPEEAPIYCAPEQSGRLGRPVDPRSDLYALGVIFFELVTGAPPFTGDDRHALIHAHIARPPPSPRERRPTVPEAIAAIILKLLAKSADERYQSAAGLCSDLERCRVLLAEGGTIEPFPLGAGDRPPRLVVSDRLHGVEQLIHELLAAHERASRGGRELVLLGGPPGSGKSRLLRELRQSWAGRAVVVGGRCEGDADPPHAPLVGAVRSRLQQLVGDDDEVRALRARLGPIVGDGGALLCHLIPELAAILGPQPPPPEVAPGEAAPRFQTLFDALLRSLAGARAPLVLLLDDLDRIDATTGEALGRLLADGRARSLLVIAAHGGELAPTHPLRGVARIAAEAGVRVREDRLRPLSLADTATLLRESLAPTAQPLRGLAEHVHARTGGDPIHTRVLVMGLFEAGVIRFEGAPQRWSWSLPQGDAPATGGLVELLAARLAELPASTRALLEVAACIGRRFDLDLLARAVGRPPAAIADELAPALSRQLIRPSAEPEGAAIVHAFTLARLRERIYAGIDEGRRQALHLALGELLRRACGDADDRIFAAVHHLNLAAPQLVGDEAKLALARLNLRAARRAALAGAPALARDLLERALALTSAGAWGSHHALMRAIHLGLAEAYVSLGEAARAEERFARAVAEARSDLDRAELLGVRVSLELGQLRLADALATARSALRLVGVDLPARGSRRSFSFELARVRWRLRRRSSRAFLDAPATIDRRTQIAHRLLMYVTPAVHHLDPQLTAIVLLRLAGHTLERGRTEYSAYGVAGYGVVQSALLGEHAAGLESLQVADAMLQQLPQPWIGPKIDLLAGLLILPWSRPLAEARRRLEQGHRGALQRGDLLHAGLCGQALAPFAILAGEALTRVREACAEHLPLARRLADHGALATLTAIDRLCRGLQGEGDPPTLLGADQEEDAALLAAARPGTIAGFHVPLCKAILLHHAGAHARALPLLERAAASRGAVQGTPLAGDHDLFAALTHAELALAADAADRRRHLAAIEGHLAALTAMAAACRETFEPRRRIAAAMAAWVRGDDDAVLLELGQAIVDARAQGDAHREGLAAELATRFVHARRLAFLVDDYVDAAIAAYARLGAEGKVELLRRTYGGRAAAEIGAPPPEEPAPSAFVEPASKSLDLATVIKATQALSSEIVLDRLLTNLLRIVMENAGARRCSLVLEHAGKLSIEAEGAVDPERIEVLHSIPLGEHPDLPHSIIHYVARSGQTVVLDHAAQRGSYTKDEYVREQGLKSVLCLPIVQNSRVIGVLYLENNLATGVFTGERLELLNQLAAQVAISVDNARLYASLDRARQAAVTADQAKTRFLMTMSHELRTPLNAIIGYTELIEEELEDGDIGNFVDDLANVRTAALRLERTLESTLELSRIEAGTFEIEWETVHIGDIARDVVAELRPAAHERGDTLELALAPGIPAIVGDRVRIRYVLRSLVDNAIRFSEGGAVELALRWATEEAAPFLEIVVRDQGIGIAPEHMPRIFTSFSQADDSTTRLYEGSGVSLAVTRHITERMGGTIAVESAIGEGSTFTIRLPAQPAA